MPSINADDAAYAELGDPLVASPRPKRGNKTVLAAAVAVAATLLVVVSLAAAGVFDSSSSSSTSSPTPPSGDAPPSSGAPRPLGDASEFDYVVVGGGSAGCVVAARLSEDPSVTVLLLESGGPSQVLEPQGDGKGSRAAELGGDDYVEREMCHPLDECDFTAPQRQHTRFDVPFYWMSIPWSLFRGYTWPYDGLALGRALGGSGVVNAMIYVRGVAEDFRTWASEHGVTGWTWDDAERLYKKTEGNEGAAGRDDPARHSRDGPMRVRDAEYVDEAGRLFREAARAHGVPDNADFNGASREGVGYYQFNSGGGVRSSTLTALLGPAMNRTNLEVRVWSEARRVTFDGARASGVEYAARGRAAAGRAPVRVAARREVLLAAGAINTAKLLLLSGVGPRADLEALGLDVVADLPGVGGNLHDHTSVNVVYDAALPYPSLFSLPLGPADNYAYNRGGALSSSGLTTGGFVRSPYTRHGFCDIQYTVFPRDVSNNGDKATQALSVSVTLNRPESRGRLTLRSARPEDQPAVSQVNLKTSNDVDSLVWGLRQVREIALRAPLRDALGAERMPGANVTTDAQLTDYMRKNNVLGNHWVGSAAMGEGGDQYVVDSQLRVRGLEALRVVDASVIPAITNGNIHATVIMVAERAAELVAAARG